MSTALRTLEARPALPAPVRVGRTPLLGALPAMLSDGPGTMLEAARRHPGELFALALGPVDVPVVYRPEHLQQVLVDGARAYTKGGMWAAARPLLGEGLVTSDGDVWKRQRQLMQPLFTPRYINSLSNLMVSAIAAQLEELDARADRPVDVGVEMTLITQRVLMESMFGGSLAPERALALGAHLATAFQALNVRLFTYFLPAWFPRPGGRAFFRSIAAIDEAMLGLVAARRQREAGPSDLLQLLLDARDPETGAPLSDREIRDQLVTLFVAGLDTTAIMLGWLLYLLDRHPEVEARLRAEIGWVVGTRAPTAEDVPRLPYTKQVIQETLRLYPPGWLFPRYVAEGAELGGRWLRPGTSLLVCPFLTHRDPEHWPEPDRFDPERFAPARAAGRERLAFIPFGAGGRACIGNHFAMMEGTLAAVMLLQRYRARRTVEAEIPPAAASTLKPKGGLSMRLERV